MQVGASNVKELDAKLYTPIILRTGFMHSYQRTLPLLLIIIVMEALLWSLGNSWSQFSMLGFERWGLIVILSIVVVIGTWTIRNIVIGYEDLFNIFDEETESKLKLYKSMSRQSSEMRQDLTATFRDEDTYYKYQNDIRGVIFDKYSELLTVSISTVVSVLVMYNSVVYTKVVLERSIFAFPLGYLEVVIDLFVILFLILWISLILLFGIAHFRVIFRLSDSQSNLSIWNFIQILHGSTVQHNSIMSFTKFNSYISKIESHFVENAFRFVLISMLIGLTQILFSTDIPAIFAFSFAIFPIVLSMVVLTLPLISLHRIKTKARRGVLGGLEDKYDTLLLKYVSQIGDQNPSLTANHEISDEENMHLEILSLREIIKEVKDEGALPFRAPMFLRIIVTALIPLTYIFLEELLRRVGII